MMQVVPQSPQNSGSDERSAQRAPEQFTSPVGQTHAGLPPTSWHSAPSAQAFPHWPQCSGLSERSTQTPSQTVGVAVGQSHWPEMHSAPVAQASPHAPQ
jgi:hypothetical protein